VGVNWSFGPLDREQRGSISTIEAVMLAAMASVLVAIAVPSWTAMQARSNDADARAVLTSAGEAADAYLAERGSFAGLTPAAMRRYDPSLDPASYRLVGLGPKGYCIQSDAGGRTWHLDSPAGEIARGGC
jgi:Tfp pilus assembly protein PilE